MRLDLFLSENGYFESRSKAQAAVKNGDVIVNGQTAKKHSMDVNGDETIEITRKDRFVSRAGEKLAHALTAFKIAPKGLTALDIGASTGGFTDCLLQNEIDFVYAIDVGTAQLADKLRKDERVCVMENFNARNAVKSDFDKEIDLIVMDVSFISQTLIYPACADILPEGKQMITLIKPQFEAGKQNIGKGGIVKDRDGKIIKDILARIDSEAEKHGFKRVDFTDSPIEGGDGNKEYLALFVKS